MTPAHTSTILLACSDPHRLLPPPPTYATISHSTLPAAPCHPPPQLSTPNPPPGKTRRICGELPPSSNSDKPQRHRRPTTDRWIAATPATKISRRHSQPHTAHPTTPSPLNLPPSRPIPPIPPSSVLFGTPTLSSTWSTSDAPPSPSTYHQNPSLSLPATRLYPMPTPPHLKNNEIRPHQSPHQLTGTACATQTPNRTPTTNTPSPPHPMTDQRRNLPKTPPSLLSP